MRALVIASIVAAPIRACSDPERITVTWSIPAGPGTSGVHLVGCADWDVGMGDGQLTAHPGEATCGIEAWRHDGGLTPPTDPVWLRRVGDQHVDFDLMAGPLAGLGLRVVSDSDAIAVTKVVPGSHADAAGLGAGSRVLAIDGVSTLGMTAAGFSRHGIGTAGTRVQLQFVDPHGEYHVAELERQRFADPGQPITVTWSFPDGPGDTRVELADCSHWPVQPHDGYLTVVPGPGRCGLVGWRRDGGLTAATDPVWLDPVADQQVTFDLASGELGGIGIGVQPDLGVIEVGVVLDGSPAAAAGLQRGSHIVEIDGVPTHGMTAAQFSRHGIGAPGSTVRLRFAGRIGDDFDVELVRQRFPAP